MYNVNKQKVYYEYYWFNFFKNNLNKFIIGLLILLFSDVLAEMKLKASAHILDFPFSKKNQYFTLYNYGDESSVTQISFENIADKNRKTASKDELIIIPKKLTLKPGQSRKIMVLKRTQLQESDQLFMLDVSSTHLTSKLKEFENEKSVDFKQAAGTSTKILVIVRPKLTHPDLLARKIGESLLVKNTGNTTIKLEQIEQCDDDDCIMYSNVMLYPDSEKSIALKEPSKLIHLTQKINEGKKEYYIG